jgi:hypothetical protein
MKRRQFTTTVAALACLSANSGLAALVAFRGPNEHGPDGSLMARQRFESRLGQRFTTTGSAETRLRLNAVDSAIRGHEQEQFHVLFNAPVGQSLPEGNYFLEANGKPEFVLHLIPGDLIDGRQQMVATVNLQQSA